MWDMQINHYLLHSGDVIEPLQTEPKAFGPKFTIALSFQEPSNAGNYSDSFTKFWWTIGRHRILGDVSSVRAFHSSSSKKPVQVTSGVSRPKMGGQALPYDAVKVG